MCHMDINDFALFKKNWVIALPIKKKKKKTTELELKTVKL